MEDKFFKKIYIYTIGVSLVLGIITTLLFSFNEGFGIFVGGISRLGGLNSIIHMTKGITSKKNPYINGLSNYLIRMLMYAIIIVVCVKYNVNIIAMAIGFLVMNIVIIFLSRKEVI